MRKKLLSLFILAILISGGISRPAQGFWSRPQEVMLSTFEGRSNTQIELAVNAKKLGTEVEIRLLKEGQPDIVATGLRRPARDQIIGILDLREKAIGAWDVEIVNHYRFLFIKFRRATLIRRGFVITNPTLGLAGVAPRESSGESAVGVTLIGAGFRPGTAVTLENGVASRGAAQVHVLSDTLLTCRFDLIGLEAGVYDLKVVGDDGQQSVFRGAFAVRPSLSIPELRDPAPEPASQTPSLTADGAEGESEPSESPGAGTPGTEERAASPANRLFKPVFFALNKTVLRADQLPALEEAAAFLRQHSQGYLILGGHTDERGDRRYNQQLAAARIEAVKRYLIRQGIVRTRLIGYPFGEAQPARTGHDPDAWAYNRRVDLLYSEERLSPDKAWQLMRP
ncbi:outer membrane protein OmpA-like peptidoglycan-associated protein [Hydrogenispora ethanolica]|uniref:Outer membrane protein OmpA-like peptidoglycan-associated protein n=1 Tax=Hydrogenispora ethanolica TaxID=1082276 RepID=A0A4R1RIL8_HYDET|nr:OmpA family protein [Hydrogenispora ethanolica]TCL65944.1 outer membrane protein OmpA-like peptidoglycan-associated protein [Hydrogenispora ethanolica]